MPVSRRTAGEWRQHPSDKSLYVSNFGGVYRHGALLTAKEQINVNGVTTRIGRVVLETFVGPCPEGMECCHYDDDPTNNMLSNLRWDTQSGNAKDRWNNNGRKAWDGSTEHGNALMTKSRVVLARLLHKLAPEVWTCKTLAEEMRTGYHAMHKILKRKNWKCLP